MKKILAIGTAVLLALPSAVAGERMAEPALGKASIGQAPADVRRLLGTPLRVERSGDFIDLTYEYRQTSVGFSEGVLASIHTTAPKACTPEGLCVGATLKTMESLYGPPVIRTPGSDRYEYYPTDGTCWYDLSAPGGEIGSITVVCQP